MKGGADIQDQQEIRRAVENGCADAQELSILLNVPVEVVQNFIDHFQGKEPAPAVAADDDNNDEGTNDEVPQKGKRRVF